MDAVLAGREISVAYQQNMIIPPMDVKIEKECITSIIGPNGCGKSTLLKALSRTLPIRSGQVLLDGRLIAQMPTAEVAKQMAILPQGPQAPAGLTVEELVSYGRYPHQKGFGRLDREDREAIRWALHITHMEELAGKNIDALSGGQRQRAWIAMALAQDTQVILLDEPTAGQDFRHYTDIMEFLRGLNARGVTVVMITHDMHLMLEYTRRALVFCDGRLIADRTAAAVLCDPALVEQAALKETSLYTLANRCGIAPAQEFVERFIEQDREVREGGR